MDQPHLETISGKSVLFVMAVPMEYGDALKARITPFMCGVGPVEAALHLTRALAALHHHENLPDHIISLGSAGSHKLEQGEVYEVSTVSYRDMDASPLGFTKGITPFVEHDLDVPLTSLLPDMASGSLSTGANIVSGSAYDALHTDMVDMETFALMRVADLFDRPLTGYRGISDGKEELSKYEDWTAYLHDIDVKLGHVVDQVASALK